MVGSRVAAGHHGVTRSALDAARRRADGGARGRRLSDREPAWRLAGGWLCLVRTDLQLLAQPVSSDHDVEMGVGGMGSFSTLVMAFRFRADTPEEVLGAFSALERPIGAGSPWYPAPALPPPNVEPVEEWEPDYDEAGWEEPDPLAREPWRHEWAPHFGGLLDDDWPPTASLDWRDAWRFECRSTFKTGPEVVGRFLAWLGPFIDPGFQTSRPILLGYVEYEYSPRPWLLWWSEGVLSLENLNTGDDW